MEKIKVKIEIEVELKSFDYDLRPGDYFRYKDEIYRFDFWDYGTYPFATNIKTNEQIQLPHY